MKKTLGIVVICLTLLLIETPFSNASIDTRDHEEWFIETIDPYTNNKMTILTEEGYQHFTKTQPLSYLNIDDDNILPNPSFEDGMGSSPDGWYRWVNQMGTENLIWDSETSYTGERSVALTGLENEVQYCKWATGEFIPFTWSTHYDCKMSAMHKCSHIPNGQNQNGMIVLNCYNSDYEYISGYIHPLWGDYQTEWAEFSYDMTWWYDYIQENQRSTWIHTKYIVVELELGDLWYDRAIDPSFTIWFDDVTLSYSVNITPDTPIGPEVGDVGEQLSFSAITGDPHDQKIYYQWDWDDGTQSDWLGPYDSEEMITTEKTYTEEGIYLVRVRAKNEDGHESEWSNALVLGIPMKNNGEDQVQDETDTGYGRWSGGYAQSFKPTQETLTQISLRTFKKGDPGLLKIYIVKELGDNEILSVEILPENISADVWKWITIDFNDIEVVPGETYYIVWYSLDCDEDNLIYWGLAADDPYPDGQAWQGTPWRIFDPVQYQDPDFCFKTYYAKDKKSTNTLQELFTSYFQMFPMVQRLLRI